MKTIEELIETAATEIAKNGSEEDKKYYKSVLHKAIEVDKNIVPDAKDLGLTPEMLNLLYEAAYHRYQEGKYNEACIIFSWLILLDAKNSTYYFGVASCYHRMKEYLKAINNYMLACAADPTNPMPFYHISDCYLKLNAPGNAICSLQMAITQAEDNPKYSKIKERAQMIQGRLIEDVERKIKEKKEDENKG